MAAPTGVQSPARLETAERLTWMPFRWGSGCGTLPLIRGKHVLAAFAGPEWHDLGG
jgi:hypothetical protein